MNSKFDFIRARIDEYDSPFSPTKTNLKQFLTELLINSLKVKQLLSIFLAFYPLSSSLSQSIPVIADTLNIQKHKIKNISVTFHNISYRETLDGLLVAEVDFDREGKVIRSKRYILFDIILSSREYLYKYDASRRIIERIEIKRKFPETAEDSNYVEITKNIPSIQRNIYVYNEQGQLVQINEYYHPEDSMPLIRKTYEYDSQGRKIASFHKNLKFPSQNHSSRFMYKLNEKGQVIEEIEEYTAGDYKSMHRSTFTYDKDSQLIQEQSLRNNKIKEKRLYEYQKGRKSKEETFFYYADSSSIAKRFFYDKDGCLKKRICKRSNGEAWFEDYACNEFGLRSQEVWYHDNGKKAFFFKTSYEYY